MRANTKTHREPQRWRVRLVRLVPTQGRATSSRRARALPRRRRGTAAAGMAWAWAARAWAAAAATASASASSAAATASAAASSSWAAAAWVEAWVAAGTAWAAAALRRRRRLRGRRRLRPRRRRRGRRRHRRRRRRVGGGGVGRYGTSYEIDGRPCFCTRRTAEGAERASPAAWARREARASTLAAVAALRGRSVAVAVGKAVAHPSIADPTNAPS